jgi:MFS family permease
VKTALRSLSHSPAVRFVPTLGVVDFFGDVTYSAGASMNGLFLGSLGAGAAAISIAGGLSEFLNHLTRGVAGYPADKTGRHWPIVFAGYAFNLLAVPALALAGQWPIAAALIVIQGLGGGARSRPSSSCFPWRSRSSAWCSGASARSHRTHCSKQS